MEYIIVILFIVFALYHKRNKEKHQKNEAFLHEIDTMDGYEFEYFLEDLFRELGYRSEKTQNSYDFGADIILKSGPFNKIVIQAKRYSQNVSISAVQEVYSAKAYYKASEAWVVTNSYYTKSAKELADACNVRLIDRAELMNLINKYNRSLEKNIA